MLPVLPVFLGSLFIGVLSALPIVSLANCCCLWIIGGGALTARLAQQEGRTAIGAGRGAMLGLFAGLGGAVIWLIAALVLDVVIGPLQQRMMAEMLRGARDMPPEARDWLDGMASTASSPLRFVAGFAFHFFAAAFAALGGALGAMFFRRDVPPALGGDPLVPPPLPPS